MLRRMMQDTQGVIKERLITAAREGDVETILGVLEEVHSDHHDDPSLQGAVDQLLSIRDSDDILQFLILSHISITPLLPLVLPLPFMFASFLFQLFSNIHSLLYSLLLTFSIISFISFPSFPSFLSFLFFLFQYSS